MKARNKGLGILPEVSLSSNPVDGAGGGSTGGMSCRAEAGGPGGEEEKKKGRGGEALRRRLDGRAAFLGGAACAEAPQDAPRRSWAGPSSSAPLSPCPLPSSFPSTKHAREP